MVPTLIGNELGANTNQTQNVNDQKIIKYLQCPSADHQYDVGGPLAVNNYWGDYTYNLNMGGITVPASGPPTFSPPLEKLSEIPSNVILACDMIKEYSEATAGPTQQWRESTFAQMNYLLGNHWGTGTNGVGLWSGTAEENPSIWIPHTKGTQCNVLCMDGHIALVTLSQFCQPGGGSIVTTTVPWLYKPGASGSFTTKDYLVGYWKNNAWSTAWNKYAPPLF